MKKTVFLLFSIISISSSANDLVQLEEIQTPYGYYDYLIKTLKQNLSKDEADSLYRKLCQTQTLYINGVILGDWKNELAGLLDAKIALYENLHHEYSKVSKILKKKFPAVFGYIEPLAFEELWSSYAFLRASCALMTDSKNIEINKLFRKLIEQSSPTREQKEYFNIILPQDNKFYIYS